MTTSPRFFVAGRSRGRCEARVSCKGARAVLMHHRQRGGRVNTEANLLHLCDDCHVWIHANVADAEDLGLLVRSGFSPADVPVMAGELV